MTDREIADAYVQGASMGDLVRMTGRKRKSLSFVLMVHGVERRDKLAGIAVFKQRSGQAQDDFGARYLPTEEEIERAAAEIRERWDERERVKRIVGPTHEATIRCFRCFRRNGKSVNAEV